MCVKRSRNERILRNLGCGLLNQCKTTPLWCIRLGHSSYKFCWPYLPYLLICNLDHFDYLCYVLAPQKPLDCLLL